MKIFLSHAFGKHNKGDVTVLKSTINLLKRIPNVEIYFHYSNGILKRFCLEFIYCLKADVILFVTRDCLSVTYVVFPLHIFYTIFLGIILRKNSILFAAQIGPFGDDFKGKLASSLTGLLLNKINLITVRDRISEQKLINLGVTTPTYLTADPGFLLKPIAPKKAEILLTRLSISIKGEKVIGINVSAAAYRYAFPKVESFKKKRIMYIELISHIIDWIIEELGATLIFMPHVFQIGNDDRIIGREIYEKISCRDRVYIITEELEPEELKGIIGLFDLFITTRFHPLIHSTSMNVPTVAIDYTFKMKDLMEELGSNNFLCNIRNITFEELTLKIKKAWAIRREMKKNIAVKIKDVKKRSELNIELVKDLLEISH